MSMSSATCRLLLRILLALVVSGIDPCEGTEAPCLGAPCDNPQFCRSKFNFCGGTTAYCNVESTWTADCDVATVTTTRVADVTTMTTTTAPPAVGKAIHSGDAIFLKVRGGSGNNVEVEGDTVQARWDDYGTWQMLVVQKVEGAGIIRAGDTVTLRAHTGKRIHVEGDSVQASWNDDGLWQTFTLTKAGDSQIGANDVAGNSPIRANDVVCLRAHTGKYIEFEDQLGKARFHECGGWQALRVELAEARPISSESEIFLKAHTGAYVHVDQTSVRAAWDEKDDWQALKIHSPEGRAIFSGDIVFLKAHTGKFIEVSPGGVGCQWNDLGAWQALTIEKHNSGPVFLGDTVFLQAHTGKHLDVEGDQVRARWNDHGAWQGFLLQQRTLAPLSTTTAVVTTTTALRTTTTSASGFLGATTTTTTATVDSDRCSAENKGCPDPDGRGISAWFTKAMFDEMFPQICNPNCGGCNLLTYNCLIQATFLYPQFANSTSDTDNKRELAAWLGIMSQETTGGGCSLSQENPDGSCTCGPMWCDDFPGGGCEAWGLCKFAEDTNTPYCIDNVHYPCVAGKKYSGRGPKQLSYNSNYGQFSEEFCGNKDLLLNHPERVATNPTLAWASSIWFWFTGGACVEAAGEICKPGCHDVLLGSKTKCPADVQAGRQYGLGWATNVVNGGLECGSSGQGKCDYRVHSRVKYYKRFCSMLGINPLAPGWTDDSNLFCSHQKNYAQSPPTQC